MSRKKHHEDSFEGREPPPGPSGFCDSASALLVIVLACIALALCIVLVSIESIAEFWPVFGLVAAFVILIGTCVAALHCYLGVHLVRRTPVSDEWMLFLTIQLVVAVFSWLVAGIDGLADVLGLSAAEAPTFFVLRNLAFSLVVGLLVARYLALQARWRRQVAADSSHRLRALQARIRPHFLFNALNTISGLIHKKPDLAEQATLDLSELLRTGLREDSHHSLSEELELVRGYLRIESLRLGDRLVIDWQLDNDLPLDQDLPALLIQPLIENAVVHGIARLPKGGTLTIRGECPRKKRLRFVIENPVPTEDSASAPGNRTALENIRQRLELAYEEGAHLRTRQDGDTFRVELVLPLQ